MEKNILHRKERLIITTIEIIDDLGIQGLSTREIAKRQGVSEATLFRHFKSKNDLLLAVLDYFSKFDKDIFESTRLKNLSPKEAIIFIINSYAEYYENYPEITSLLQIYDVLRFEPELSEKIKQIFYERANNVKLLIEDAQKAGEIRSNADSDNLAYIINGISREICLKWRMEDKEFSLRDKTITILKEVLDSFQ